MKAKSMFEFDQRFVRNPPASELEIENAEKQIGKSFPGTFKQFLNIADGGEGPIGPNGYVAIWAVAQIPFRRSQYEFDVYADKYVPIGSNGASEALVVQYSGNEAVFGYLPFADLNDDSFIEIHHDFWRTLDVIAQGKVFD